MRALLLCLVAGGCFQVDAANGKLKCNSDASRACPSGYHCAINGTCWHSGQDPVDDLGMDDLGGADLIGVQDAGAAKHRGDPCSPGDTCETGNCVDGYCCDASCGAACTACNLPGLLGACSPVPIGMAPVHSTCSMQDVSTCGRDGLCDGTGMCELWPSGSVCAAGGCTSGKVTGPSTCNGSGTCVAAGMVDCDPYVCRPDGGVCYDSCTDNTQCLTPNPCNTSVNPGSCGPKSLGGTCASGTDCKSGNCVDGVCCDMPQAACNGCKACNVTGSEGHCANVAVGIDPHNACGSVCADKCDGSGACRPASATTICSVSNCQNTGKLRGQFSTAPANITFCDGLSTGSCAGATGAYCPGGYICASGTMCGSSCNYDIDCTTAYYCSASHACTGPIPNGNSCTRDMECSSKVCVSGVCRQCRNSADCPGSICSNGTCVNCQNGSECGSAGQGSLCGPIVAGVCSCNSSNAECTDGRADTCDSSASNTCRCGAGGVHCGYNQRCASGTCRNPAGFPCLGVSDCASGVCTGGVCG